MKPMIQEDMTRVAGGINIEVYVPGQEPEPVIDTSHHIILDGHFFY